MSHLPLPAKGCYYDLNIPYNENQKDMDSVLSNLKELGYSVIAFSKFIASGSLKKDRKQKKQQMPPPPVVNDTHDMMQLSRITIELDDIDDKITVRDACGIYDIISVVPKTEKLFLSACTELNVDIITLDCSERLPYFFRTHQVRAAIARGIYFEFNYAPMVRDPTVRRLTTTSALKLVECCKSKNMILSSKAIHPLELRGPFDVANLALLFAMKENIVPHVVSHNCRCVVVHSFARKTAKGAIFIQKMQQDDNLLKRTSDIGEENSDSKRAKIIV